MSLNEKENQSENQYLLSVYYVQTALLQKYYLCFAGKETEWNLKAFIVFTSLLFP